MLGLDDRDDESSADDDDGPGLDERIEDRSDREQNLKRHVRVTIDYAVDCPEGTDVGELERELAAVTMRCLEAGMRAAIDEAANARGGTGAPAVLRDGTVELVDQVERPRLRGQGFAELDDDQGGHT